MMGFFATFCGFLYNDFASIPFEFDQTCQTTMSDKFSCVYPFGIDHQWYQASNRLAYFNSLKMKLAVIFGVTQMSIGIFIKAANSIYFNKMFDFLFEFLPQIILLWSIFGYMVCLIIIKWKTYYENTNEAPSIISVMINMFLNFGEIKGEYFILSKTFNERLHIFLLFVAFVCIPAMLIIKPILI